MFNIEDRRPILISGAPGANIVAMQAAIRNITDDPDVEIVDVGTDESGGGAFAVGYFKPSIAIDGTKLGSDTLGTFNVYTTSGALFVNNEYLYKRKMTIPRSMVSYIAVGAHEV